MAHYKAYFIGHDGRVASAEDLTCADDDEAKKMTEQLLDGLDIELWQRERRIAKFPAKK